MIVSEPCKLCAAEIDKGSLKPENEGELLELPFVTKNKHLQVYACSRCDGEVTKIAFK
jgi:hypothetical protein